MWSLDYIDEDTIEECKKSFSKVYPEFKPLILGVTRDKQHVVVECEFPDGTFWFRVTENTVSNAYKSKEDADRG
mgnify:CR=1 FL=1